MNHDRELRDARTQYIGAVRRLHHALRVFDTCDIPMDPGPGPQPRPWTARHVTIMRDVAQSFAEVIQTRRRWDTMRRQWRAPH